MYKTISAKLLFFGLPVMEGWRKGQVGTVYQKQGRWNETSFATHITLLDFCEDVTGLGGKGKLSIG